MWAFSPLLSAAAALAAPPGSVTQSDDTDKRGSSIHFSLSLGPLPTPRGSISLAVRSWAKYGQVLYLYLHRGLFL